MSLKIFYFSGTGNSFVVSRKLEKLLIEKGEPVPLSTLNYENEVIVEEDVVGFVFPVYFQTIPDVAENFIKKLSFKTDPYIFAIATCNGVPGHSLFTLDKYLKARGKSLSSSFVVDMPGNAFVTPEEIIKERLENSDNKIEQIADCINNRRVNTIEGKNTIICHLQSAILGTLAKKFQFSPKTYSSTSECTGCGICEKVCPVQNIKLVNQKPIWEHNCTACLACFHWCPKKAVYINKFISNRDTYHHPEVTIKDMSLRK